MFKKYMAQFFPGSVDTWPYNSDVLKVIYEAKKADRKIYLATATDKKIAGEVARYFGIFDTVIASENGENLKGVAKLERIKQELSGEEFDYIGDSHADLPIWLKSRKAFLVGSKDSTLACKLSKTNVSLCILPYPAPRVSDYVKELRPSHWAKNFLIFIPLLLLRDFSFENVFGVLCALIAFSLCASIIYVANDIIDLPSDRKHPDKKSRPLASGVITISHALIMMVGMLTLVAMSSLFLSLASQVILSLYLVCNALYSFWLKRNLVIDVVLLAGFYIARIFIGSLAIYVWPSNWLVGFSWFIFFGLSLVKRVSELMIHNAIGEEKSHGRSYRVGDIPILESMAVSCGFSAVVLMALYIDSLTAAMAYSRPFMLWGGLPLFVYWYGRVLILTHRGKMLHDPLHFVMSDKISLYSAIIGAVFFYFAV